MEYKDQIKSPKWQKKRLEILKRDEFTCQECGNKEQTLHVHHKHYNKGAKIWEYENWELTTLCETCHSKTHDKKTSESYNISEKLKSLIIYLKDNFKDDDFENIGYILEYLPENTSEKDYNEYLSSLSYAFNWNGFVEKLGFEINNLIETEQISVAISLLKSDIKRIGDNLNIDKL